VENFFPPLCASASLRLKIPFRRPATDVLRRKKDVRHATADVLRGKKDVRHQKKGVRHCVTDVLRQKKDVRHATADVLRGKKDVLRRTADALFEAKMGFLDENDRFFAKPSFSACQISWIALISAQHQMLDGLGKNYG
jgi:hypothetical protein